MDVPAAVVVVAVVAAAAAAVVVVVTTRMYRRRYINAASKPAQDANERMGRRRLAPSIY